MRSVKGREFEHKGTTMQIVSDVLIADDGSNTRFVWAQPVGGGELEVWPVAFIPPIKPKRRKPVLQDGSVPQWAVQLLVTGNRRVRNTR